MRALVLAVVVLLPLAAQAFCGFYVSSAGAQLFNDASMVSLMRDGTRTVLAMQNNYRGPTESFALVVPVPVVLKKEMVKTLPREVFERLDTLTSPRLVEEFEPGQCPPPPPMAGAVAVQESGGPRLPKDLGVKVEAKFSVGEYDIVILSAKDALGLDIWLRENKYKIPDGAAPLLKPYVAGNWKFFVAKVDAKKVKFDAQGQAVLSPLRFHYDSNDFVLPVRLGLMNSAGTQDLIVTVIAKQRYELANQKTVMVPTNVRLKPAAQAQFGGVYSELIKRTFEKNPGAAITEFAWEGALPPPQVVTQQGIYGVTCDPCPPPHPMDDPLAKYLGADVLPNLKDDEAIAGFARTATMTRLHLRYGKDTLSDDLVLKAAEPVAGGVPETPQTGAAKQNRFQGRYIIRKPFDPNRCFPTWGRGAPPPVGITPMGFNAQLAGQGGNQAQQVALTEPLEALVLSDVPELGLKAKPPPTPATAPKKK